MSGAGFSDTVLRNANEAILTGFDLPDVSEDALATLAKAVGSQSAIVFSIDLESRTVDQVDCKHHRAFAGHFENYRSRFFQDDPIMKRYLQALPLDLLPGSARVVALSDCISEGALFNGAYYSDFLREVDVCRKAAVLIRSRHVTNRLFAIGFHRPRHFSDFSENDLRKVQQLAPAFSAAVEQSVLRQVADRQAGLLEMLRQDANYGPTVIVDENARVLFANDTARSLLACENSTQLADEILSAYDQLRASPEREAVAVRGTMKVGSTLIPFSIQQTSNPERAARYLITAKLEPQRPQPSPGNALRVTRREAAIIEHIAGGHGNKAIAALLCISTRTVENHLRSIYHKMGVNSRTQLIAKIYEPAGLDRV